MLSSLLTGPPEINKVRVLVDPGTKYTLTHSSPQKFSGPSVPLMVTKGSWLWSKRSFETANSVFSQEYDSL